MKGASRDGEAIEAHFRKMTAERQEPGIAPRKAKPRDLLGLSPGDAQADVIQNFAGLDGGACSPLPRRPRSQDFLGVRTYSAVQSGRIVEITLFTEIGPK